MGPSAQPRSYWAASAQPAPSLPALDRDRQCDVVIIGGGFTGMATALALMDRGVDCVLLEATEIGAGASGRNGGSATPRYKPGFGEMAKKLGAETARLLHTRLHEGIDLIEAAVARFAIACDFRRCGQMTAAHTAGALAGLEADVAWHRTIGDREPRLLDAAETRQRLGMGAYKGAYLDMRGASLHPLNYVRGLAAGLQKAGVALFAQSPVTAIRDEGAGVTVETAGGGTVRARFAVLATDAYLARDLTEPGVRSRFLTVASAIVTTEPLPEEAALAVVPGRHVAADTFTLLNYFQMLPDGRLMFGGRGTVSGHEDKPSIFALLERRMRRLFPQIGDVPVSHRWSGMVGLTEGSFPVAAMVGQRTATAFGYAGRGVVPSHILGRALAGLALGRPEDFGPMLAPALPPAIRFHAIKRAGMRAAVGYFGLRDRLQGAQ